MNKASLPQGGSAEKHVCSTGEWDTPTPLGDASTTLVLNCNKWHASFAAGPLLIPTEEERAIEQAYRDALWARIRSDMERLDAELSGQGAST